MTKRQWVVREVPVEVWRHDILKVSASMVSTPEEPRTGEMREAMA